MKRTPLKRGRRKPRPPLTGFWAEVTENGTKPCALRDLGGCSGLKQAHHYWPKQRLVTHEQKADARNGVCLCWQHHQQVEWARVVCPRPPGLDEFLADHGIYEREVVA